MDGKLKNKLLKLYELSKRGIGGEKINAEFFLNKLLEKHDLTIDDIDSNLPKKRFYKYKTKADESIISQVAYKITGDKGCIYTVKGYKEICLDVTDYQHVQIIEEVDFHLDNFKNERKQFLEDFRAAYVQKHRLFPADSKDNQDDRELTAEEKQAIWRMSAIKQTLNNKSYTKKIE